MFATVGGRDGQSKCRAHGPLSRRGRLRLQVAVAFACDLHSASTDTGCSGKGSMLSLASEKEGDATMLGFDSSMTESW